MGIKKGLVEERIDIEVGTEEIIIGEIEKEGEKWRIIRVYAHRGVEIVLESLER